MAANNVTSMQKVENDVRKGYADAASFYRDNLDAMVASSQAMIRGMQAVNSETLAFYQARMKETLDAGRRLIACQNPEAAWETQVDFMRSSIEAYSDEFKKMTDMSGKLMNESLSPLASRTGAIGKATSDAVAA
ncbi:MAG TPA: phasin family protein [Geminicoccaceae bacterium]